MSETLENLLQETRQFPPPAELASAANVTAEAYDEAAADRLGFWEKQADRLDWATRWDTVLDWSNPPFAKWFVGGQLNIAYNCLDRRLEAGRGDKVAYHWEGEPGDTRTITYHDLHRSVCQAANALTELGIQAGDRVAIYLPMIPELPIAMLACARIGATHNVVFGGFSVDALRGRIQDADAKLVITADGGFRRGNPSALKPTVDEAVADCPSVEHVLVVRRTGQDVDWHERDVWWHESVEQAGTEHTAQPFDAEHPLFILYTSGTTAKPKGILHTTGGYLTQVAYTHWAVFDLKPETDVYWCTADIGWVTGHSYIVYGPLANGATSVIYEGTPDTPHRGRFWELVEKYRITIIYTAPTAIRTFAKWGDDIPAQFDLSSLRLIGSVGEPINPEAWIWYRENIGGGRCPVVDTWWQTETGHIMISPLPGFTPAKPGSATKPLPGIAATVLDEEGDEVSRGEQGLLALKRPWPGMLRTLFRDPERFKETYFSKWDENRYYVGDAARKDEDGYIWVIGRADDAVNVSGHLLSTAEVESAIVSHPKVAEAAVIGMSDEDTGQAICAFVILEGESDEGSEETESEVRERVAQRIGKFARPKRIIWTADVPKTRSGKIMRRLLRDIASGNELGDVTTLREPGVMKDLEQQWGDKED